jgi:hypothetical protein
MGNLHLRGSRRVRGGALALIGLTVAGLAAGATYVGAAPSPAPATAAEVISGGP